MDDPKRLKKIVKIFNSLNYPAIFPIHPRTKKRLAEHNYRIDNPNVRIIEPLGYLDFLLLLSEARLVLTDSGGLQEETNILHVPCITLRDNTERPETVTAGSNIVAGVEPSMVLSKIKELMENRELEEKMRRAEVVFGDGNASNLIVEIFTKNLERR